jgi:hypothetical protein
MTFQRGESFGDYVETRCGSPLEFPCYCNPDLPNQMECPYCGFVDVNGELLCAHDGEIVTYFDGDIEQTCSCEVPDDPLQNPTEKCGLDIGSGFGTDPPFGDSGVNATAEGCTIADANGALVTIPNGESFGDLVDGVCGDALEWPSFCNAQIQQTVAARSPGGSQDFGAIEYPYCVYTDTITGSPECARNNEFVTYTNMMGEQVECSCTYTSASTGGAQSTCGPVGGQSEPPKDVPMDPTATDSPFTPYTPSAAATGIFITRSTTFCLVMLTVLSCWQS